MLKISRKYIKITLFANLILVGGNLSASPEQSRIDAVHREEQRLEDQRLESARIDQQLQQQRLEHNLQNRRQDNRRLDNARWDRQHGR
ncbi:MAG: hypothetical protein H0W50_06975 [Parachlamydiaceae bacterium]|nr:hypothetical protein [Parachlamydiaceae bacterium]